MHWEHFGVSIHAFHCEGNTAPGSSNGRIAFGLPAALHANTCQCIPVHPSAQWQLDQPLLPAFAR